MTATSSYDQIGKYGTLMFLKQHEDNVVAAFGIDRPDLTFGRDSTSDVRLLYPNALPVHCKIRFDEDHKAFLHIYATSGVALDGEPISAHSSTSHVTVPLANNAEIQILRKRFRFCYPPREMRPVLYNSPAPASRRKPRISLIESSQVFNPCLSPNPRDNLRVLKSPLRPFTSPLKENPSQSANDDEEVLLVEGNNPEVVEENKDLVILEQVERIEPPPSSPTKLPAMQTPLRRPQSSLHRQVLLKSAQRVATKQQELREEDAEMDEVFGVVSSHSSGSESDSSDEVPEEAVRMAEDNLVPKASWRESLGRIWPFRGSSAEPHSQADKTSTGDRENEMLTEEASSDVNLDDVDDTEANRSQLGDPRLSVGHELQPRRIFAQAKSWKVQDIVIPPGASSSASSTPSHPMDSRTPKSLTQEQRKAISERRRSALMTPDTFFGPHGVPGMSPERPPASPSKPNNVEEANANSRDMLTRLKGTMAEVKRRQSLQPNSPQKPLFPRIPMDIDEEDPFSLDATESSALAPQLLNSPRKDKGDEALDYSNSEVPSQRSSALHHESPSRPQTNDTSPMGLSQSTLRGSLPSSTNGIKHERPESSLRHGKKRTIPTTDEPSTVKKQRLTRATTPVAPEPTEPPTTRTRKNKVTIKEEPSVPEPPRKSARKPPSRAKETTSDSSVLNGKENEKEVKLPSRIKAPQPKKPPSKLKERTPQPEPAGRITRSRAARS